MKAKIIYGSDTGNTEVVVEDLTKLLDDVDVVTVDEISPEDWDHDKFILGIPTWYDGELQSDWEDYFDIFRKLTLREKQ
jgi:flavodoxin I